MKRPTRSEEESYRVMFFIISSLIMGTMIWFVFQETFTRRPWKNIQHDFFKIEQARAKKNLEAEKKWLKEGVIIKLDEEGDEEEISVPEQLQGYEAKVAELEGDIVNSPKRVKFEKLKAALADADQAVKDQEMKLAFAKADEDEYYYYYRNAKHHGHTEEEKEFEKKVDEKHEHVLEETKHLNEIVADRGKVLDQLDVIQKELKEAKRHVDELRAGLVKAERNYEQSQDRYVEMHQYWNQRIDLVDRCHTCHMGADKCGFAYPQEILEKINKEGLKADEVRARFCVTRAEAATYVEVAEEMRDSWGEEDELTFEKVRDKLPLKDEPVLAFAKANDFEPDHAEAVFRTHRDKDVLLGKHPGLDYGCTTCHYGQGRQTKGVGLNYLKGYMAPFNHARNDHYWEAQLLDNAKHHTEASCFNCHKYEYELDLAPHFTDARKLVTHLGCTGCHPLGPLDPDRKHGPVLSKVASKIDQDWLLRWITYPKGVRPRTRMPNFWPEVVNDKGTPCNDYDFVKGGPPTPARWVDCAEKRDREVGYIAAYLTESSEEASYPTMPSWANADKGKDLFEHVGCMACHNMDDWQGASHMPGDPDRDFAPNLTGIGSKIKTPGWIYEWVRNPKGYWHETRMPSLRLDREEAWHIAAYLDSKKAADLPAVSSRTKAAMEEEGAADKGKQLIGWYGCSGCHDIPGFESSGRIGVELTDFGSKLTHKLDFGDVEQFVSDPHAQTWSNWTNLKIRQPRVYRYERVETRMPQFDLTEKEAAAVILFLKSQNAHTLGWPEDVKHHLDERGKAIQEGAFLIDAYNCVGCHRIDDKGLDVDGDRVPDGGRIFARFHGTEDAYRAPPKLINQGRKLYPEWFFAFLKEPFKLRENYQIRMPSFELSDEVTGKIVAYFAAKADSPYPYLEKRRPVLTAAQRQESAALFEAAQCLKCHNLGGPSDDPKNVAPNLRLAADRLQYDWLFDWLKDPQVLAPGVGMPGFFYPDDDNPGEYVTPLPNFAGGDWRKQIDLLRAFVIGLGGEQEIAVGPPAPGAEPQPAAD